MADVITCENCSWAGDSKVVKHYNYCPICGEEI